jgi:ribonuclease III
MLNDGQTARIQQVIEYTFKEIALLETALTHKSYTNENPGTLEDNQRLEFLGDAVLGLVMAETLMTRLESEPEGALTQWRASLVNEGSLAEMARSISLGDALRLGHGEMMTNGQDRSSTLADAMESLIGAVYLDGGFEEARRVVLILWQDRLEGVTQSTIPMDAKGALQEILQARQEPSPYYHLIKEEGPDHAKVFEVAISHKDRIIAVGRGRSKKEAEKRAAKKALREVIKCDI